LCRTESPEDNSSAFSPGSSDLERFAHKKEQRGYLRDD
jgi:hypothetical protein